MDAVLDVKMVTATVMIIAHVNVIANHVLMKTQAVDHHENAMIANVELVNVKNEYCHI